MDQGGTAGAKPPGLFDASWIRQAITYIGVTGAGGGGFAALCFGIGFLATRHHDEMLGLPSRATAYGAMVRTGAMFFPNSLYYLLVGTWKAVAAGAVLAMVAWVLYGEVAPALRKRAPRLPAVVVRGSRGVSFLVIHSFLLFFALVLFEDRAATLHPENRHLLLDRSSGARLGPPDRAPVPGGSPAQRAQRAGPVTFTAARAADYFVLDRLAAKAERVNGELRQDSEVARKHYGQSVAFLTLLVILLAVEYLYWRDRSSFRLLQLIIRPVLYVLAVTLLVTLPAAYGVLWMSKDAIYVEITTTPSDPPITGYLLTDISGDEPDVWTLALADTTFAMRVFKRESISEIRLLPYASTDNLLSVARVASASPEPREGVARADNANAE